MFVDDIGLKFDGIETSSVGGPTGVGVSVGVGGANVAPDVGERVDIAISEALSTD